MSRSAVEDKDDVFIENLNTAMLLILGILALFASVAILGYSAIAVVYSQQLTASLLTTLALSTFLFSLGLGSLHLFRRRRESRREKTRSLFYRVR